RRPTQAVPSPPSTAPGTASLAPATTSSSSPCTTATPPANTTTSWTASSPRTARSGAVPSASRSLLTARSSSPTTARAASGASPTPASNSHNALSSPSPPQEICSGDARLPYHGAHDQPDSLRSRLLRGALRRDTIGWLADHRPTGGGPCHSSRETAHQTARRDLHHTCDSRPYPRTTHREHEIHVRPRALLHAHRARSPLVQVHRRLQLERLPLPLLRR